MGGKRIYDTREYHYSNQSMYKLIPGESTEINQTRDAESGDVPAQSKAMITKPRFLVMTFFFFFFFWKV